MVAISLILAGDVSVRHNLESMTRARRFEGVNAGGQQKENELGSILHDALEQLDGV